MKVPSTVLSNVRTAIALAVMAVLVTAAVVVSLLVQRPAASTVGLIPAACATVDPVRFPCALPSMGVRW